MAAQAALFGGLKSIPFAFYRSGTSRGLYLLERDVPPRGPARDALLCRLMGSGHPQQLEGFGGGCGPTSKAVIVGPHPEPESVTYTFAQCKVEEATVDHSHGDCGNMLAAVGPFALERGLVQARPTPSGKAQVRVHSSNTGAVYVADVMLSATEEGPAVCYKGRADVSLPGVPSAAAPVVLAALGVSGLQTGRLLPTGNAVDRFDLGAGFGEVSATVVDFARALVMVDADEVLPRFGYHSWDDGTKERIEADCALNGALDHVRRAASLAIGLGDCVGKDSPKVALVGPPCGQTAMLACRYFVNPERCEMHPTLAMTAAQAVAAGCLLEGSVPRRALGGEPTPDADDPTSFTVRIAHPQGVLPVTVGTTPHDPDKVLKAHFPQGVPSSGKYTSTVLPLADGRAFV
mmetsp:Transcript_86029/g.256642  ORF Transcript_86029/g.256642 Transcript_86029/m.256642 type:complete len:404 (-) Transcript_86029:167-1378(-)